MQINKERKKERKKEKNATVSYNILVSHDSSFEWHFHSYIIVKGKFAIF